MDLMEYKAKEYFDRYHIPGPTGFTIDDAGQLKRREVNFPVMVKAQAQIGGRGKAGGVKPAANPAELEAACQAIIGMNIKGRQVKKALIVEKIDVAQEWYLAIALDRVAKGPTVIFSPVGGVDIEETTKTAPNRIVRLGLDPLIGIHPYHTTYLVGKAGIDPKYTAQLHGVIAKLYQLFTGADCTLCEINPLCVTPADEVLALDAKVTVDDAALFRHPELIKLKDELEDNHLVLEAGKFRFLFIPCDPEGSVAVMSNGSGMIMSCIDVLSKNGVKTRAALDLGGGATSDRIREAIRITLSDPGTKGMFINIFGGITRCDEVAGGVRDFMGGHGSDKLIVVRFEGTNKDKGMEILNSINRDNVVFADGLYEGVEAIGKRRASL